MSKPRGGLGRGLGALIPTGAPPQTDAEPTGLTVNRGGPTAAMP
jgi:hypothetical protein